MGDEKDKTYLVDEDVDTSLTEEEKSELKKQKENQGEHGRQDVFIDRRDPHGKKGYDGPDRRQNRDDRRL